MSQNTNLNVSPYYDDFNEDKNYNKVLFKPGFPVQSRELTTLQSILQNQIERFGQYFFKEGSTVIPGGTVLDTNYFAVRIDPNFLGVPVKAYTKYLADNEIEIKGETSGVVANVVNSITDIESEDGFDTLYIKYKKSGSDGVTKEFIDGENLITSSDIEYSSTRITANSIFARTIVSESTKIGSSASISEGIFYIRGFFVKVPSSTIILDQYTNTPSYRIGLSVTEEIVTASSINNDLYDNAKGFSNESAPGADRFRLSINLVKKSLTDSDDLSFIELLRTNAGAREEFVNKTDFNTFKDELARRTYEESGDYYVKPFKVELKESLNDRLGNRGLYFSNQVTKNGNTPSDDIYTVQISSGKAYVRGNEVDKQSTTSIDAVKPRTTRKKENVSLPIQIGNISQLENVFGTPTIGFEDYTVDLLDRRLDTKRVKDASAVSIGLARVYDFNEENIAGAATTQYFCRLYDVQTFTNVTVGLALTAKESAYVEGRYSGSSGYLVNAVTNGTVLSLSGVRGEFQLNEPLDIDGISIGRNVTEIRDYDFDDVKSIHKAVGVSTFCGDLVLDRDKESFSGRSNFTISADDGNVTSTSIADFRSLVKVGDIVRFSKDGGTLPTFNRVTHVNKSGIGITAVADVDDVCDGTLVTGSDLTTNDFDIIVPSLKQSSNPGYIVPLANSFVSTINLLDSNYVVRKQISKSITSTSFTFQISDLGDNDLTFEPFTSSNYVLLWEDGIKELIRSSQVTLNASLTEITFTGLSRSGLNATLTFTAKRIKLLSKDKSIQRCASLIVDKSKFSGAGIGSTTFNNGLNGPAVNSGNQYPYGTRVEDETISLNVPDVTRVLGIFVSNGTGDPVLPSITVSSQTATFTNNILVGDQFIGSSSGSVARVTSVDSGIKISFVYENQKSFEVDEIITFVNSGIVAEIDTLLVGDSDITDSYKLDTGHRLEFADYGRIVRNNGVSAPNRKIKIIFDHLKTDESLGNVESINSYNSLDYGVDIPVVNDIFLGDAIDTRPRVGTYTTTSSKSPFDFDSRSFTSSSSDTIVSNKTIVLDYSYYLGRTDRLYLTKDGRFELVKGVPSENPKAPAKNDEAMEVAVISMQPYVFNAEKDSLMNIISHRRYTMKDIAGLEGRIKNLEDYTTLSLLETDTKNLSIKDPNTGLDKFKSGFFVENFRDSNSLNLTGESFFDIDKRKSECRPRSTERNVSLGFETKTSASDPINSDYAWINDFDDSNITRNGPGLTLAFDEVQYIEQPLASRTENLNPFHITLYAGSIQLSPESDFWVEENIIETTSTTNLDSAFSAVADLLGVNDRENGGMASSVWNTTEINWTGSTSTQETIDSRRTDSQLLSSIRRGRRRIDNTFLDTFDTTVETTTVTTGVESTLALELGFSEDSTSLGYTVVSTENVFTVRSRNIEVSASNLKPNTRYYVFMENINMNSFAVPKVLPVQMITGSFATGDIVQTTTTSGNNPRTMPVLSSPDIQFRVAQSNHKAGPFNSPTETYSDISSGYSNTSNIVNIDTADLALLNSPRRTGWVSTGQIIASANGAQATVGSLNLITDDKGSLTFTLHIPDPNNPSNPKFSTGSNNIKLTTSPTNATILDPGESAVNITYISSGIRQNLEEQLLSIRQPTINPRVVETQPVTEITTDLQTVVVEEERETVQWVDPLAQSFLVEKEKGSDGVFITSGELYFKTKDPEIPVTVEIRTIRDGAPTSTIVPFGKTKIESDDVVLSDDGSAPTIFKFNTPVYLQGGYEYCLVVLSPTSKYLTFITRMGEVDLLLDSVYNRQPYLGSLFKSQNNSTWTPTQLEDLKFKLNKAKFKTNTPSTVIFYNNDLPMGQIKKNNPVTAYSKRQTVSIASTTTIFEQGTTIKQGESTANVFGSGGPVKTGTGNITLTGAGIGLTPSNGSFTFTGIGFTTLSGDGTGLTADITVTDGAIATLDVQDGGSGYSVGDLLLTNNIGATGSAARVTVGVVTETNSIILDDVTSNFNVGVAMTHYDGTGTASTITGPTAVLSDNIRDGFTLEVDHRNHGMHSAANVVKIENFVGDISPTQLSAKIDDNSTTITVADGSEFVNFEGSAVGAANTGYIKVDKEIISYNSINGNEITIANRAIDSSLKSNHSENTDVFKYEFNEVSLLKINKEHNLDDRKKTFNSYYIKLSDTTKSFSTTKQGGGPKVGASQNIPFEYVKPDFNLITPSGTSVSGRIKTISGTSISGNEVSFTDKGYENITLNKLNNLDDPRIVASTTNEYNILNNKRSFALEMTLSTINENVSPIIDLESANVILTSNLVNSEVTDYETDRRARLFGQDPNSGIYESKKINLEFSSNSIYVQFDGHRDSESDFKVFYKLFRNGSSDNNQVYIPFNSDGSPDKLVNPNTKYDAFSEYKYTADNIPQFNSFMIKIVMTSTNQAKAPRFKNLRAIALRSFENE